MTHSTPHRYRSARHLAVAATLLIGALVLSGSSAGSPLSWRLDFDSLEPTWWVPFSPVVESSADEDWRLAPAADQADPEHSYLEPSAYVRELPFGSEIVAAAGNHRLDALLVASVIEAESSFRPDAISPKGALGLMQVMPFHLEDGVEALEPSANLEIGASYLAQLLERYDDDLALGLAAYHAGPGAVDRFGGVPPYSTTQSYVARVLSLYEEHLSRLSIESDLG